MTSIHLLVLVHGMWGNPNHLAHMDKVIREVKGATEDTTVTDRPELAVLLAKTNQEESTYDGIDWGGERVAQEVQYFVVRLPLPLLTSPKILDEVEQYENQGKKVTRFSILGYSLGGLLARYVVGYVLTVYHQYYAVPLTESFQNSAPK